MEDIRDPNLTATGGLTPLVPTGEEAHPIGGRISLSLPAKSFYFVWSPCVGDSACEPAKPDLGFPSRSVRPGPCNLETVGTKLSG